MHHASAAGLCDRSCGAQVVFFCGSEKNRRLPGSTSKKCPPIVALKVRLMHRVGHVGQKLDQCAKRNMRCQRPRFEEGEGGKRKAQTPGSQVLQRLMSWSHVCACARVCGGTLLRGSRGTSKGKPQNWAVPHFGVRAPSCIPCNFGSCGVHCSIAGGKMAVRF